MESARLKLHATGFFGLFLTRSRGGDSRRTACASKPTRDFFEMALKLVIGNKNYSSWSMRPWLALRANNIPFDEVFIPLYTGEADKQRILSFTHSGKVPVLIDGDITIWDSLAIIEYAAERFPEIRLWPEDRARRAHARSISAEMHSGFAALRNECGMNLHRPVGAIALSNAASATARWGRSCSDPLAVRMPCLRRWCIAFASTRSRWPPKCATTWIG